MSSKFRDELLESYSDEELLRHIVASPRHPFPPGEAHGPFPSRIRILSENLLAKGYDREHLPEVTRAVEVAHRLGIRVPKILRIVRGEDDWGYCIMERIHGPTLAEAWAKLGWFTTVRLALQLRRFVRLLRSVTSTTAGQLVTGRCYSFYLDDRWGLPDRASMEDVKSYIQFWARFTTLKKEVEARDHGRTGPPPRIPPMGDTFVLVHHDLKARNLVLGPSGQLWVIDWDVAGFYPIYFDQNLKKFHKNTP
ncbi:uncharacterized protein LTHEOB_11552 [Lasiodiplodia theobromae]|uniref:uncharacterized protein n=1 Tax=Lasiodiplodia theobromae TaxID=45133 RepID=UPI0015C34E6D|nr:uncharacterized protein LTHEOB_11552 [Lasiodiplodia theobromae]KAF4537174.1 hypothetical protein LTHEOB_11552 [Lasiodiplodia theobromae]